MDYLYQKLKRLQVSSKLKALLDSNQVDFVGDKGMKFVVSYKTIANDRVRSLQIVVDAKDAGSAKLAASDKLRGSCPDGFQVIKVEQWNPN